jgi:hypothetical protein
LLAVSPFFLVTHHLSPSISISARFCLFFVPESAPAAAAAAPAAGDTVVFLSTQAD